MKQPTGFTKSNSKHLVCWLKKALYSLKQVPRAWFERLSTLLMTLGFFGSKADPSLFYRHKNGQCCYILIYVDDIIITGSSLQDIQNLIFILHNKFSLKDLGKLSYFLEIEVSYPNNESIFPSQSKYITDLLQRAKMFESNPIATPMVSGSLLSARQGDHLSEPFLYKSVVGALQYVTLTRPEISFSVNKACQFMHSPTTVHWQMVKRILR